MDLALDSPLPNGERLGYDLLLAGGDSPKQRGLAQLAPHLLFPQRERPDVVVCERIRSVLHGSCRKPHHAGGDGRVRPRQVKGREPVELYNASALGRVEIDDEGIPSGIEVIHTATGERVVFRPPERDGLR